MSFYQSNSQGKGVSGGRVCVLEKSMTVWMGVLTLYNIFLIAFSYSNDKRFICWSVVLFTFFTILIPTNPNLSFCLESSEWPHAVTIHPDACQKLLLRVVSFKSLSSLLKKFECVTWWRARILKRAFPAVLSQVEWEETWDVLKCSQIIHFDFSRCFLPTFTGTYKQTNKFSISECESSPKHLFLPQQIWTHSHICQVTRTCLFDRLLLKHYHFNFCTKQGSVS